MADQQFKAWAIQRDDGLFWGGMENWIRLEQYAQLEAIECEAIRKAIILEALSQKPCKPRRVTLILHEPDAGR